MESFQESSQNNSKSNLEGKEKAIDHAEEKKENENSDEDVQNHELGENEQYLHEDCRRKAPEYKIESSDEENLFEDINESGKDKPLWTKPLISIECNW